MLQQVQGWLQVALEDENFKEYQVELKGQTSRTDGFLGHVLFATAEGITKDGKTKKLNLVLKVSKDNEALREDIGGAAFQQEQHVYETIFPFFERFQKEKNIKVPFRAYPKCYKCLKLEKKEVLVFDNLRAFGYQLHDKRVSQNLAHTRTVLAQYAKYHALSFALRDQNKKKFDELAQPLQNIWNDFWKKPNSRESSGKAIQEALEILRKRGNEELYSMYSEMSKYADDEMVKIYRDKEEQCVITHGDCWNNNFMFQYKDNDHSTPASVMILDWQISYTTSPAHDLTYYLLISSTKNWKMYDELLKEYHQNLTRFLVELGTSPDVFTYQDLQRHWRKWRGMALALAPMMFKFLLSEDEALPDFGAMKEGTQISEYLDFELSDEDAYYLRLTDLLNYFKECS